MQLQRQGYTPEQIGVLLPTNWRWEGKGETIFLWGEWGQWEELARRLFEGLRWLEQRVTVIVAPLPPPLGLGLALRDRLQKAASPLPAGEALVGDALQSH